MIKTFEKDIQKACIHHLKEYGYLFIRNNSVAGNLTRPNGSQGYIRNNMPGSPDLFVFVKKETLHVELKSSIGKQSPEQKEWERLATDLGHKYYIIRSVEELVKILSYFK
jgi:hypothetical protein